MNAGLHKLVFNAKRGMLMAVNEEVSFSGGVTRKRSGRTGRSPLTPFALKPLPWALSALAGLVTLWAPSVGAVQGGQVVQGNASISTQGVNTQILQSTPNAVIQWQNFNIGARDSRLSVFSMRPMEGIMCWSATSTTKPCI